MKLPLAGYALLGVLFSVCRLAPASESPQASIAQRGELIFSDDFERAEIGPKWRTTTPTFAIHKGALRGSQTKPEHGAVIRAPIGQRDFVLQLRFRFEGATGINIACNDAAYKEGHAGHICRVELRPAGLVLADDKTRLTRELEEMRKTPEGRQHAAKLSAAQSVNSKHPLEKDRWYELTLEVAGDTMRALLDGQPIAHLVSPGIAHPMKSEFNLTVSGDAEGFASIDDVRVWKAEGQ